MRRHWVILVAMSAAASVFDHRTSDRGDTANRADDARHVIVVVSDGMRWQEVFRGADSTILFSDQAGPAADADAARRKYWRPTATDRRAALMPFVWGTLVRQGQLRGNRDLDSRVQVANGLKFSYPGYNEMLTGRPDPRIDSNEHGPNPNVTIFERLNRRPGFTGSVAVFGTWDTFQDIFNVERSRLQVFTNGSKPHDNLVHRQVLPYVDRLAPRALFVGFAETDDWGHEGRYDRFLDAAHAVDGYLADLWAAVQSNPRYRDRTTLIFTADHGRGRLATDWRHHGVDVAGAEETFLITAGPGGSMRGEVRGTNNVLGDVALLTAAAVGLRYDRACAARADGLVRRLASALTRADCLSP